MPAAPPLRSANSIVSYASQLPNVCILPLFCGKFLVDSIKKIQIVMVSPFRTLWMTFELD